MQIFRGEFCYISSLLFFKKEAKNQLINSVNRILFEFCNSHEDFEFIDNSNVVQAMLHTDGIHLSHEGRVVFSENIVNCINDFL